MYERLYYAINALISVNEADWAEIKTHFSLRTILKGQFYSEAGTVCQSVCFIQKGACRTYAPLDGDEVNWFFHFEGNWVSDYDSFLNERPCEFSIQAIEDAEIVVLNKQSLYDLYAQHPRYERIGRLIAESLFLQTRRRGIDFLLKTPEQRLAVKATGNPPPSSRLPHGTLSRP